MKSAIIKRSVVLEGHKTSVSLENEFWEGLREIADRKNANMSMLVRQIDRDRRTGNLSSAIRVFVFNHFRGKAADPVEQPVSEIRTQAAAWPAQSAAAR